MQPIEAFIMEMREDVLRFERYWLRQHKKTPAQYPLKMESGDWFEQFLAFIELKDVGT